MSNTLAFILEDTVNLTTEGYPKHKATIYVVLSKNIVTINEMWRDATMSILIDLHCMRITTPKEGGYIWIAHNRRNCYHCGDGLNLNGCPTCGTSFKDDGYRTDGNAPLPLGVINYVSQLGISFNSQRLAHAYKVERKKWEQYLLLISECDQSHN